MWRAFGVILGATTFEASCLLLVDQSPSGDQFSQACGLANATTTCGACMTQSCAAELTACCGDVTCRGVLAQVDQCAEAGTCVFDMTLASASALGKCIDSKCPACSAEPASAFDGGGQTYCSVGSSQTSCSCTNGYGLSNATRCDVTTVPNAVCCADKSWPSAGTSCTCGTVQCEAFTTSGDCSCSPSSVGNAQHCNTSFDGVCCTSDGFCNCSSTATDCGSQPSVGDCSTPDAVGCSTGQVRVNNCSPSAG